MLQKYKSKSFIVISMIIAVGLITGCSNSTASGSETAGVGYITESTVSNTYETSGSVSAYQVATLTWETSGTVAEVNVSTNDTVSQEEVLMSLDTTTAPSDLVLAVTELINAQAALESAKTSTTSLAEAEVALAAAQVTYNEAAAKYATIGKTIGSDEQIAILRASLIRANEAVTSAEKNYNRNAELSDTDAKKAQAYATLAQARIDAQDALSKYLYYSNPPSDEEVASITSAYNLAKSQLEDAQREYDRLASGDNSDVIASAQAEVDAAQAKVNKLSIIAPFDGDVAVVYSQPGDIVAAGDEAAIVINRSKLYIDVTVDEASISSIAVGDTADITFDSLGITATGKVSLINPIGTASYNVVNYTVRVDLDNSDPNILIGATASVVINVGEPVNTLFAPVSSVLYDNQGEYVMRVKSDGTTERVNVVSGSIYDETVVVSGNLSAGDTVQLYTSTTTEEDTSDEDQGLQIGTMGGGEMPTGGGEMPSGGMPSGGGGMPSGGGGGMP